MSSKLLAKMKHVNVDTLNRVCFYWEPLTTADVTTANVTTADSTANVTTADVLVLGYGL